LPRPERQQYKAALDLRWVGQLYIEALMVVRKQGCRYFQEKPKHQSKKCPLNPEHPHPFLGECCQGIFEKQLRLEK